MVSISQFNNLALLASISLFAFLLIILAIYIAICCQQLCRRHQERVLNDGIEEIEMENPQIDL